MKRVLESYSKLVSIDSLKAFNPKTHLGKIFQRENLVEFKLI